MICLFRRLGITARQSGFTLVELLVVISIIALLSSIILASLSQIREKALNTKISGNIHQYVQGLFMYSTDHQTFYQSGWVCLGHGTNGHCGFDDNYTENPLLISALDPYVKGTPAVSDETIPTTIGGGSFWRGAKYYSPNGNPAFFEWFLKGVQSCGYWPWGNVSASSDSISTECLLTISPQ